MLGVGVRVSRPSSTTAPMSASVSSALPDSASCSIEVLCLPTRSAPAMRFSSGTRNEIPSFDATSCASVIIFAASARASGNRQMSTRVAWVSALIGLKERLPHALSQISERMFSSTGALNPARCSVSDNALTLSVTTPSSSPTGNRVPSI